MAEDFRAKITRTDIEEAIAALDRGEPHEFGRSTFYDLLEAGKRYPPKAVVGLAARRALGRALRPDEFSGGEESWSFRLLRDRGFNVVRKPRNETPLRFQKCLHRESGSRILRPLRTATADRDGNSAHVYGVLRAPRAGQTATRSCGS
jgi:hypothetical protein